MTLYFALGVELSHIFLFVPSHCCSFHRKTTSVPGVLRSRQSPSPRAQFASPIRTYATAEVSADNTLRLTHARCEVMTRDMM